MRAAIEVNCHPLRTLSNVWWCSSKASVVLKAKHLIAIKIPFAVCLVGLRLAVRKIGSNTQSARVQGFPGLLMTTVLTFI